MMQKSFRVLMVLLVMCAFAATGRADTVSVSATCTGCVPYIQVFNGNASGSVFPLFFMDAPEIPGYPELSAQFQPNVLWGMSFDTAGGFQLTDGSLTISGRITSFDISRGIFYNAQVNFSTATDIVQWIDPATGETINIPQAGAGGGGYARDNYAGGFGGIQVGFDLPETPVPEPGTFALLSLGFLGVGLGFAAAHGAQKR